MQGIKSGPVGLALLALSACMPARPNQYATQLYQGAYDIEGNVAGTPVSGTLSFDERLYYFESNHGSCTGEWQKFAKPSGQHVRFGCGPLSVRFTHSGGRMTDRALATVTKTEIAGYRKTCVAWTTDQNGRRVCSLYRDEPVERKVRKDAYITVAPAQ